MLGKVTHLYDISKITIPEDFLKCSVSQQEIDEQLQYLAAAYASQVDADTVEIGTAVTCSVEDAQNQLFGRPVLLFPGKNISFSVQAEKDICGHIVGDVVSTVINGNPCELKIMKILTSVPAEVNSDLIAQLGIENVSTVEEYCTYFSELEISKQKAANLKSATFHVLSELVANSEIEFDEKALAQWLDRNVAAAMERFGDQEVKPEQIRVGYQTSIEQNLVLKAVANNAGVVVTEEDVKENVDQFIEMNMLAGETNIDREEMVQDMILNEYFTRGQDCLSKAVEKIIGGMMV